MAGDWKSAVEAMQRKAQFVREAQGFIALADRLGFKKALELQLSRGNTDFGGISDAEYASIQALAAKGDYAAAVKEVIAPKLKPSRKKASRASSSDSEEEGGAAVVGKAVCGYCGKGGHFMMKCFKFQKMLANDMPGKSKSK